LAVVERSLACPQRHTYDIARHGHVTLARGTAATGDDADMVAARAAVFDAGHYAPLTAALAGAARAAVDAGHDASLTGGAAGAAVDAGHDAALAGAARAAVGSPRAPGLAVLDLGAGTGHHLAGVLAAWPAALGIALDASRPALRRAVRAHANVAGVVADVWQALPLRDATVDVALDVFSPRNAAEMARVLKPGGVALVAVPTAGHLAELADLHGVRVDPEKAERLERTVGGHLRCEHRQEVRWTMALTADEVERVLRMSPAGAHRHADRTPSARAVTGSVELWTFRRRA
jgi:SAM-dependent methyltransferase